MTTAVFYPFNDYALIASGGMDWASLCAASGTSYTDNVSGGFIGFDNTSTDVYNQLRRCYFQFDTSSIGTSGITSAKLSLYGYQKIDTSNKKPQMSLYSTKNSSTPLANYINYDDFNVSGYNEFTLNAAGLASINRTGMTEFYTKSTADATVTAPNTAPVDGRTTYVDGYLNEQGGDYRPKLEITYDAPFNGVVSGLRHIYNRQVYNLEITFGGVSTSEEIVSDELVKMAEQATDMSKDYDTLSEMSMLNRQLPSSTPSVDYLQYEAPPASYDWKSNNYLTPKQISDMKNIVTQGFKQPMTPSDIKKMKNTQWRVPMRWNPNDWKPKL
jgi:hypothetical protein